MNEKTSTNTDTKPKSYSNATDITMKYQKKVIAPENQMMIRKLADSTIGIYSCVAVLFDVDRFFKKI